MVVVNSENPRVVLDTLLIDESVKPIQDLVVISFLLLERRRRKTGITTVKRARSEALVALSLSADPILPNPPSEQTHMLCTWK